MPAHRMPTHAGACHCAAVRFEIEAEIERVTFCNCSLCARTGYLHTYVTPDRFRLLSGAEALRDYVWGTGVARHMFCGTCGISPFRHPRSHPELYDVNVRCLEGIDAEALPVERFDGQHWERSVAEGGLRSLQGTGRAGAVPGLTVRAGRRADYPRLRELFEEVDVLHRQGAPALFRRSPEELRPDALLDALRGDSGALLVAEAGETLGFAVLLLQRRESGIFQPGAHAVLDNLVVARGARRRGVGQALLGAAEAWAREHGALRMELNVYEFNADARAFYEAAGYDVMCRRLQRSMAGAPA